MAKEITTVCDLCLQDGRRRLAIGVYWDEENREWDVCGSHLETVKEAGLYYEVLKSTVVTPG